MADEMTGTYEPTKYPTHPAGSFAAVCGDFINLGRRRRQYKNDPKPVLLGSVAVVFYAGEDDPDTGKPMFLAREFDVKLSPGSYWRDLLEGMRGQKYTPEELAAGIPFHRVVGKPCTLSVSHNEGKNDRIYANIDSAKPMVKGLVAPQWPKDYQRAPYWAKSIEKYSAEVVEFERQYGVPSSPIERVVSDDDLPF